MKQLTSIALSILLALAGEELAAQQVTRKDLLLEHLPIKISTADLKEITIPPRQKVPLHIHPCTVVGYIISGEALFQMEGRKKVFLKKGDAFLEPKNKKAIHFDNASTEPLVFLACYLKEGKEANILLLDQ